MNVGTQANVKTREKRLVSVKTIEKKYITVSYKKLPKFSN